MEILLTNTPDLREMAFKWKNVMDSTNRYTYFSRTARHRQFFVSIMKSIKNLWYNNPKDWPDSSNFESYRYFRVSRYHMRAVKEKCVIFGLF